MDVVKQPLSWLTDYVAANWAFEAATRTGAVLLLEGYNTGNDRARQEGDSLRASGLSPRRFADLMDLSKDRSRLDFFLRKAHTAPPAVASPSPPDQAPASVAGAWASSLLRKRHKPSGQGRLLQHAASAPDQAAAAAAAGAAPAVKEEKEEVGGFQDREEPEDDDGDDDAVLAAKEAAWQRAVLAEEERMMGAGGEDQAADEGGEAVEEPGVWQDGGCLEACSEEGLSEGDQACDACSQELPDAAEGCSSRGGKRGADDARGRGACLGRPAASEEEVVRWSSGASSSSDGQPGGRGRAGAGQGAAKRAKRARAAAELVHLGLDSPPAHATRPAVAAQPNLVLASSACRPETGGSAGSAPQEAQAPAPPLASRLLGAQQQQEQERAGRPAQRAAIKRERQGSPDSWETGERRTPAVKAEQGAPQQEQQGGVGGSGSRAPPKQEPRQAAGLAGKPESGRGEAAGEVVDLAGVDVAEQARILRHIAAGRKALQQQRGSKIGACGARSGGGACQASLKAFFKALPPGAGERH